jgi:hypothetical protein
VAHETLAAFSSIICKLVTQTLAKFFYRRQFTIIYQPGFIKRMWMNLDFLTNLKNVFDRAVHIIADRPHL